MLVFHFLFSLPPLWVLLGVDLRMGMTWPPAVFWVGQVGMSFNLHQPWASSKGCAEDSAPTYGHEEASLKLLCMENGGNVTGAFPPFSIQRSIDAKRYTRQGVCEAEQVWEEMVAVALSKWKVVFSCSCDGVGIWKVGWCHQMFWSLPQVEAYGRVHTKCPCTYISKTLNCSLRQFIWISVLASIFICKGVQWQDEG